MEAYQFQQRLRAGGQARGTDRNPDPRLAADPVEPTYAAIQATVVLMGWLSARPLAASASALVNPGFRVQPGLPRVGHHRPRRWRKPRSGRRITVVHDVRRTFHDAVDDRPVMVPFGWYWNSRTRSSSRWGRNRRSPATPRPSTSRLHVVDDAVPPVGACAISSRRWSGQLGAGNQHR